MTRPADRLAELAATPTRFLGSDLPFAAKAHRFEDEEGERMQLHPWSGLPSVILERAELPPGQDFHVYSIGDGIHMLWEYYDISGGVKWSYAERDDRAARYFAGWRT